VAPADDANNAERLDDKRSFLRKLIDEQKNWEPSGDVTPAHRCCGCGRKRSYQSELTRAQLYDIFEEPMSSRLAMSLSAFIMTLIAISILCFVLQSEESVADLCKKEDGCYVWDIIEAFCTIAFTVEFISRFCVCDVYGETVRQFLTHPLNIFDFLAIMPWYIDLLGSNFAGLRIIRLARVLRLLKVARYSSGLQTMIEGLRRSMQAISILMAAVMLGCILSSSMIYYAENREGYANPDMFPSIPGSFWWALVTMTTVGYGDRYPMSVEGKLVASVTMIFGILLIALPMAIVGNKFQEVYHEKTAQHNQKMGPGRITTGPYTQAYLRSKDQSQKLNKRKTVELQKRVSSRNSPRSNPDSTTKKEDEEGLGVVVQEQEKDVTIDQFTKDVKDLVELSLEVSAAMRETFASAATFPKLSNELLDLIPLPVADGTGGTGASGEGTGGT
jgi:hypothetical protein